MRKLKAICAIAGLLLSVVNGWSAETKGRYRFETQILAEGSASFANPTSQRTDVIRMGETITIQEPLMTYGGDVIIIADTLRLLAPIDTRPYVEIRRVYWNTNYPPTNLVHNFGFNLTENPGSLIAHDQYFHWTQVYDTNSRMFSFQTPQLPPINDRYENKASFSTWSVSGPSAIIDHPSSVREGTLNGIDAPTPIQDSLKSGNIYIMANRIEICGNPCTPLSKTSTHPPLGDIHDRDRSVLLMTDGLKGGYGSPGPIYLCTRSAGPGNLCHNAQGGFSGKSGNGHDAGSVELFLMGDWSIDIGYEEFEKYISVQGGNPPYIKPLRTPSIVELNKIATRLGFLKQDGEADIDNPPKGMIGKPGKIVLHRRENPFESISALSRSLSNVSLDREYDMKALLEDQDLNNLYLSSSPRGLLREYLRNELNIIHATLLSNFRVLLESPDVNPLLILPEKVAPVFADMKDCEAQELDSFDDHEKALLRKICHGVLSLRIPNYFWLLAGGIMSKVPTDIKASIERSSIVAELASINAEVSAAVTELKTVGNKVQVILDKSEENRLLDQLQAVKDQLRAAESQYAAAQPRFPGVGEWIQFGVDVYAMSSGLEATEVVLKSQGWAAAGKKLKESQGSANGVLEFAKNLVSGGGNREEVLRLKRALQDLERVFAQFQDSIAQERRSAMKRLGARTKRTVDLFSTANSKQKAAALNFEDLFRALMQWHLRSPDRQISSYVSNAKAIESLISNVTIPDNPLTIGPLRDVCANTPPQALTLPLTNQKQPLGCVSIVRDSINWKTLWYVLNKARKFPLVVIKPGNGTAVVSLDWLAAEGELEVTTIAEFPQGTALNFK